MNNDMSLGSAFSVLIVVGWSSFYWRRSEASSFVEFEGWVEQSSHFEDVVDSVRHGHRGEDETKSVSESHGYVLFP